MAFRTGKYNIAGASSIDELYDTHRRFTSLIESLLEVDLSDIGDTCEIRNMVFVDEYDRRIDINWLILVPGNENIEDGQEQFP